MPAPRPGIGEWRHQGDAINFAQRLWHANRPGVLFAMAMGTGKTRPAIELIHREGFRRVLILCPLRVVDVWCTQLQRFANFPYHFVALDATAGTIQRRTQAARETLERFRDHTILFAINYEAARVEPFASWALHNYWDLVIADESHRLKTPASAISRFAGRLSLTARRRLALTGTPLAHSPLDIWAQYRFLDRSIFDPTYTSFKMRYALWGGYHDHQIIAWRDLQDLEEKMGTIAFRVSKEVLDLPPEIDETLATELEPEARRIYQDLEDNLIAWLGSGEIVTAHNALVRLLRLQQVTGGTLRSQLADANPLAAEIERTERQVSSAKEALLEDLLEDLAPDEPVVVFAQFRSDLAAIHRVAKRLNRCSGELSGATGSSNSLGRWRRGGAGDPIILAVQMQAGSEGIDLTRARYGVYYSTGFSLALYLQSRARLHRPGQLHPVAFYHLVIRNSIDEKIQRALARRQDLVEAVLKEMSEPAPGLRIGEEGQEDQTCRLHLTN